MTSESAAFRTARKIVVAVVGGTVLALGIAMIVLPGPAIVVIPIGLAILGTEFIWARRLLRRFKSEAQRWTGHAEVSSPPAAAHGNSADSPAPD
jgi:tellurite resistance protein TerC